METKKQISLGNDTFGIDITITRPSENRRIYVNNEQLEIALAIALDAHKGQVDLDGKPAILHALDVGLEGGNLTELCVGFLHADAV